MNMTQTSLSSNEKPGVAPTPLVLQDILIVAAVSGATFLLENLAISQNWHQSTRRSLCSHRCCGCSCNRAGQGWEHD